MASILSSGRKMGLTVAETKNLTTWEYGAYVTKFNEDASEKEEIPEMDEDEFWELMQNPDGSI